MSLAHKYVNQEPYNQDIKEQVTTKTFLKRRQALDMKSQPQKHNLQKVVFFKFNPLFVVLTFQIIYQWPESMKGELT